MMAKHIWLAGLTILCVGACVGASFGDVNINVKINVNDEEVSMDKSPPIDGAGGSSGNQGPPWGGSGSGGGQGPPGGQGGPPGWFFPSMEGWKPASKEPCPDPAVVQNFNLTRYLGRWYEVERMYNPFQEGGCVTADYSLRKNGTVKVVNSNGKIDTPRDTLEGTAIPSSGTEGRLTVSFPMSASGGYDPSAGGPNYNILLTDYDNYAIVYTCASFKIPGAPVETKMEFGWILSRASTISSDNLVMIKDHLKSANIDTERFNSTNQEGCTRLPKKKMLIL